MLDVHVVSMEQCYTVYELKGSPDPVYCTIQTQLSFQVGLHMYTDVRLHILH